MRFNPSTFSLAFMAMSGVLAAPVPVAQPAGGGIALTKMVPKMVPYAFKSSEELVKFLNKPKVSATVLAGNILALYFWLTNEWDRKDQLRALREKADEGSLGLQGLTDEDIERIRDVFMEAMSAQGDDVGDGTAPPMPGSNTNLVDTIRNPSSVLEVS